MFCNKCGNALKDNAKFCNKCGNRNSVVIACEKESKNKSNKWIFALFLFLCIILGIVLIGNRSSGKKVAEAYIVACNKKSVNKMHELVPSDIEKNLRKEYDCTKDELNKSMKNEISYWVKDLTLKDSKIINTEKINIIDKSYYSNYFDRRLNDCLEYDKISSIEIYRVSLNNLYYYEIPVFKYKGRWYCTEATSFVAYSAWEC